MPLSEVVPRLLTMLDKPTADVIVTAFSRWEEVVGADVARHCRPVAIDADRLVVAASDPMWADELRWNSQKVLDRLAEVSGGRRLGELVVRVEPHGTRGRGSRGR